MKILQSWLSEPFLHFLLAGAALFAGGEWLERRQQADRYSITVSQADLRRFAGLWEKQYGAGPTAAELEELAENYVRQEVLYREALGLGLDKGDEVVKRRLVQKLEFLQQDLWTAQEPPEAELKAYYQAHPERYQTPERASFRHLYFSEDQGADAKARALKALAGLEAGRPAAGDRFPDASSFALQSREDARRVFGSTPAAAAPFEQPPGRWAGPFASGYGWHLVYVEERTPAALADFGQVRAAVRNDWRQALRQRKNAEAFEAVRRRYTVVREDAAPAEGPQQLVSR